MPTCTCTSTGATTVTADAVYTTARVSTEAPPVVATARHTSNITGKAAGISFLLSAGHVSHSTNRINTWAGVIPKRLVKSSLNAHIRAKPKCVKSIPCRFAKSRKWP
jgi:hypothetical protein